MIRRSCETCLTQKNFLNGGKREMTLNGEKMMAAHVSNGGFKGQMHSLRNNMKKTTAKKTKGDTASSPSPDQSTNDGAEEEETKNSAESVNATASSVCPLESIPKVSFVDSEVASKLPAPPLSESTDEEPPVSASDIAMEDTTSTPSTTQSARFSNLWRRPSRDDPDQGTPDEKSKQTRRWFSKPKSEDSREATDDDIADAPKAIKRTSSFSRRKPSTSTSSSSVSDKVMTAGRIVHNQEREDDRQRRYAERMARARSGRRPDQEKASPAPEALEWPDDDDDNAGPHENCEDVLSSVEEEEDGGDTDAEDQDNMGPGQEGVYVRRNGKWYDMNGSEFRPKRVIRFVWR